jgi:hypothetical protein
VRVGGRGRYGDLSGVEGQRQRRLRGFKRLAGTGDATASSVTGSLGEDWRAGIGGNAMLLRVAWWPVENQLRERAALRIGGLGVVIMRCRSSLRPPKLAVDIAAWCQWRQHR